jgi:hypothetical protein
LYEFKNVQVFTNQPGEFALIVNVRGVETSFNEPRSFFTVTKYADFLTQIFTVIEAYFAFFISSLAILTASYGFKWYLSPITLSLLALFSYYVTTQIATKGVTFVVIILVILYLCILVILVTFLQRLCCKDSYFYDQKRALL